MPSPAHAVFLVPSQFPTIQQAIDAVSGPATLVIEPGLYCEDLSVAGKASLVIQSARLSRRGVVLAGHSSPSVLTIESSAVYLSGIEIRSNHRARGICAVDSSISLQECVIAGNAVSRDDEDALGGGMLCRESSVRVQKSTIAGNTVNGSGSARGGGLHLTGCRIEIAGSTIQANAVYAAATGRGAGIWAERCRMRMWRSRVTDNLLCAPVSEGAGLYLAESIDVQLGGSVITGNDSPHGAGGGVFVRGEPGRVTVHGNTVVRQNHPGDLC